MKVVSHCLYCGKKIEFLPSCQVGKYCSNRCQQLYQSEQKIEQGTAGWTCLRNYIKRRSGGICEICGVSRWLGKPIVLICDHIDGNPYNNSLDNLRAICSNCDATLPTYKSKNRGHGRKNRKG